MCSDAYESQIFHGIIENPARRDGSLVVYKDKVTS